MQGFNHKDSKYYNCAWFLLQGISGRGESRRPDNGEHQMRKVEMDGGGKFSQEF